MTQITLMDGSIGQELVHRSARAPTPLWSTRVMIDAPDLVAEVHADYFSAGATMATTNTYAIHRSRLVRENLVDDMPAIVETAILQAKRARDQSCPNGRIAGSLGPFLASYRPDLNPDPATAAEGFAELARLMASVVDLFLIETVSSVQEARGALTGTLGHGKPVWLALTVMDDDGTRLRSGENLTDIAPLIEEFDPAAVLINCSRPEAIPAALDRIASFSRPFGAYANGFTRISDGFLQEAPTVDALTARSDLGPSDYAEHAMAWLDQGATIVGGCCEVGPAHIAEIARRLKEAGFDIV